MKSFLIRYLFQDIYYEREKKDRSKPWARMNSYWDDKSPDLQWNKNQERNHRKSFQE